MYKVHFRTFLQLLDHELSGLEEPHFEIHKQKDHEILILTVIPIVERESFELVPGWYRVAMARLAAFDFVRLTATQVYGTLIHV